MVLPTLCGSYPPRAPAMQSDKLRLLPVVALLRTVLASFPAHGSSLYQAIFKWPSGLDGVNLVVLFSKVLVWIDCCIGCALSALRSFCEVCLIFLVIRCCHSFDFYVPTDRNMDCFNQVMGFPFTIVVFIRSRKDPVSIADSCKILAFDPSVTFFRVFSAAPLPYWSEDMTVYVREGLLGNYVLVIISPTPNYWIQDFD